MKFANITTTAEIKEEDYAKKVALRKLQSMKPRGILRVCLCVDIYIHLLMISGEVKGAQLVPEYTMHLGVLMFTESNTFLRGACADVIS